MKIIKIDNCADCPYIFYARDYTACLEKKYRKLVNADWGIPDWCPLEDYVEPLNEEG